uniref:Uncharacterized protein n=1 Tax=Arundo donax TaxID=35708 RepID=A0A0A8YTD6_ARUDO
MERRQPHVISTSTITIVLFVLNSYWSQGFIIKMRVAFSPLA